MRKVANIVFVAILIGCLSTLLPENISNAGTTETELVEVEETTTETELETEIVEVIELESDKCTCPSAEDEEVKELLSEEMRLQLHLFYTCKKYNVNPFIVIALIERESYYTADAVSKNGAVGLMQLVPEWHKERMDRLNCHNLFDPYQNITVGVDYLAWLFEQSENNNVYWVLMAYNGWTTYANRMMNAGKISDYAKGIVERAKELEKLYYTENW